MTTLPTPPDHQRARVMEQALRERLLDGEHLRDVEAEVERDFVEEVASELVINPDLSENTFLSVMGQIAVSYDDAPDVSAEGVDPIALEVILPPGVWAQMQDRELKQRGVREVFVRLDWPVDERAAQEVSYRVVPASMIHDATPDPLDPTQCIYVEELRPRTLLNPQGEPVEVWTYDVWDLRDGRASFRVEAIGDDGAREDITERFYDTSSGPVEWPYMDGDGQPIMPYVLYHGQIQRRLWDYKRGIELVNGTLRAAVGYTRWWDSFMNAADPVRVGIDVQLPAGSSRTVNGGKAVSAIPYTPKTVLLLDSTKDGGGRIDHFQPGLPPLDGIEALRAYTERLAVYAGLSPNDLTARATPQSGIAIIVSREGQRAAQRKSEPSNRAGDQVLLATAARMANGHGGANLPTNPRDYRIQYARLGLSQQERKTLLENLGAESAMGVISKVTIARRLNPALESDADAIEYLRHQAELDRQLAEVEPDESAEELDLLLDQLRTGADPQDVLAQIAALRGIDLEPVEE